MSVPYVVVPESCGALEYAVDGTVGPTTCPDGRPNMAADRYYRMRNLRVLSLGPNASPIDVDNAICADMADRATSIPIEGLAVQLAEAEQAWHFAIDPAQDIMGVVSGCSSPNASSG
jgi:hypothetical protein